MTWDLPTRSWTLKAPFDTPPGASVKGVFVTVTGELLADSLPPTGVTVAVISPSGRLFVGVIVATPWSLATASPIRTSLLSYSLTVVPAGALTVTSEAVLALPSRFFSITGTEVASVDVSSGKERLLRLCVILEASTGEVLSIKLELVSDVDGDWGCAVSLEITLLTSACVPSPVLIGAESFKPDWTPTVLDAVSVEELVAVWFSNVGWTLDVSGAVANVASDTFVGVLLLILETAEIELLTSNAVVCDETAADCSDVVSSAWTVCPIITIVPSSTEQTPIFNLRIENRLFLLNISLLIFTPV